MKEFYYFYKLKAPPFTHPKKIQKYKKVWV